MTPKLYYWHELLDGKLDCVFSIWLGYIEKRCDDTLCSCLQLHNSKIIKNVKLVQTDINGDGNGDSYE